MSTWGVDQALPNAAIATAAADVSCPAATATTVVQATPTGVAANANVLVVIECTLTIVLGATAPSAMTIVFGYDGLGAVDTFTVPPNILVNAATLNIAPTLAAVFARGVLNVANPMQVQINPTGQAVTLKAQSRAVFQYTLAADA